MTNGEQAMTADSAVYAARCADTWNVYLTPNGWFHLEFPDQPDAAHPGYAHGLKTDDPGTWRALARALTEAADEFDRRP